MSACLPACLLLACLLADAAAVVVLLQPPLSALTDVFFSPLQYLPPFLLGLILQQATPLPAGTPLLASPLLPPLLLLVLLVLVLDAPQTGGAGSVVDDALSNLVLPGMGALLAATTLLSPRLQPVRTTTNNIGLWGGLAGSQGL